MQLPGPADQTQPRREPRSGRGAVLLEVLLALGLFVVAAAVVTGGLNAAVERTIRLRAQTHALDLAASVISEIQMGLRASQAAGPESFEAPFDQWTWEIEVGPYTFGTENAPGLQLVTVIVRGETPPTVQRLTTILVSQGEAGPVGDEYGGWDGAFDGARWRRLIPHCGTATEPRFMGGVVIQQLNAHGDKEPKTLNVQRSTLNVQPSTIGHQPSTSHGSRHEVSGPEEAPWG
ncbi:MAG TPA: hypothetical protein PKM43_12885 [Verrucomicrobiota bacterium]|nr:hypothetical protein [Verrucomicrobiota bacterium]HRZ36995.1 hypothetical protein [Candidatus Paceibacterota bacterium]HRZ54573.1 hypothetical protein [Candidatus Paceibacterota bacterium]